MFSPKVLDRANTIEFRVSSDDLTYDMHRPVQCEPGNPGSVRTILALSKNNDWQHEHLPATIETYTDNLRMVHEILSKGGFSLAIVYFMRPVASSHFMKH